MSAITQPPAPAESAEPAETHREVQAGTRPVQLARPLMLLVLLLAFVLRAWHLDYQSLWSDEGISLQRALLPLPDLLRSLPVEHTPGYFVLLGAWVPLAGDADFALRYLSLLPSVLSVALIYALGRRLLTGGLGMRFGGESFIVGPIAPFAEPHAPTSLTIIPLTAALLLATGGFQVWYAQEARMYASLLALSLVSMWAQWELLEGEHHNRRAWGWAAAYACATAGVVYLHLYGALLPLAQAVFAVGWIVVRRDGRTFARWTLAALAALLLFAPWLPHAWGIFAFSGWREGGSAADLPGRYWLAYTVSDGLAEPWRGWLPWLYLLLLAGGVVYWWRVRRAAALYLLVLLIVPLAAAFALAVRNPDYHERYTIFLTAPILLLVAGGVGLLGTFQGQKQRPWNGVVARSLPFAALLLLLLGNGLALGRLYTDASLHKPDYRAAAARIAAGWQEGDVVLVDGPDPAKVFLHYFRDGFDVDAPVHAVGDLEGASYAEVGEKLAPLLKGAKRVWEVLYFHPPAAVQVWLATQAWATEPTDHNGIRVTLYGLAEGEPVSTPLNVTFGPALTLQSVDLSTRTPHTGDLLRVSTHWFVNAPLPEYKFSLRLVNAAGEPVYTVDYVPQNWFAPTSVWVVGQEAADQRGILLPNDLPAGVYRLTLRLYDPLSGAPAGSSAGEDVLLGELTIE